MTSKSKKTDTVTTRSGALGYQTPKQPKAVATATEELIALHLAMFLALYPVAAADAGPTSRAVTAADVKDVVDAVDFAQQIGLPKLDALALEHGLGKHRRWLEEKLGGFSLTETKATKKQDDVLAGIGEEQAKARSWVVRFLGERMHLSQT